jgi:Mitochondrial carrier protein
MLCQPGSVIIHGKFQVEVQSPMPRHLYLFPIVANYFSLLKCNIILPCPKLIRFYTFNVLNKSEMIRKLVSSSLLRNAGIGLIASIVADSSVNAIRVVKTTKQAMGSKQNASYADTVRMILAADGWKGLLGRGLKTRILANALQSMIFTVVWRALAEKKWKKHEKSNTSEAASSAESKNSKDGPNVRRNPEKEDNMNT